MRRRKIYSSLDKDRLRTAADRSRARHLSELMDKQEREEQDYYDESTNAYNKSRIFKFSSNIEKYVDNFIYELNEDIKSAIEEYKLYDVGIWEYIDQYLKSDGSGLTYIPWSIIYDRYYEGVRICLGDYKDVIIIATYEGSNHGDPNDYYFDVESIRTGDILDCIYTAYHKIYRKTYDETTFYNFVIEILDSILNSVAYTVDSAIEDCLMDNPPPLE